MTLIHRLWTSKSAVGDLAALRTRVTCAASKDMLLECQETEGCLLQLVPDARVMVSCAMEHLCACSHHQPCDLAEGSHVTARRHRGNHYTSTLSTPRRYRHGKQVLETNTSQLLKDPSCKLQLSVTFNSSPCQSGCMVPRACPDSMP